MCSVVAPDVDGTMLSTGACADDFPRLTFSGDLVVSRARDSRSRASKEAPPFLETCRRDGSRERLFQRSPSSGNASQPN